MQVFNLWKKGWMFAPLLLVACTTLNVTSDRYPQADLSHYRTFAWIASDPYIHPRDAQPEVSALTQRRIRESIAAELAGKGYIAVDAPANADFVVAFSVGARDRIEPESYPLPYRGPWLWSSWGTYLLRDDIQQTDLHVYREGSLSIDIFDGASRQPVWNGLARKVVTAGDVSDPGPIIGKATAAILKQFPSRRAGDSRDR